MSITVRSMSWDQLPDIQEVYTSLRRQADLKANLRAAKLELEIYQAGIAQEKPRNSAVKLIGYDDSTKAKLSELLRRIIDIEQELDIVDADVKFNEYRRDVWKSLSYGQRI